MKFFSFIRSPFFLMPLLCFDLILGWMMWIAPVEGRPFDTANGSENLLANAHFDVWQEGQPADWEVGASDSNSIQFTVSETIGYVDGSGLYVDVSKNDSGSVMVSSPMITVEENSSYFFKSFYVTDTALSILAEKSYADDTTRTELIRQLPDYDYDWSSMSSLINVESGVTKVRIHVVVAEKGFVELDAAYFVKESDYRAETPSQNILSASDWQPFRTGVLEANLTSSAAGLSTSVLDVSLGQAGWQPPKTTVEEFELYDFDVLFTADTEIGVWADFTRADGSSFYRKLSTLNTTPQETWAKIAIEIPKDAVSVQPSLQLDTPGNLFISQATLRKTAAAKSFEQPRVSITFDDGWASSYENGAEILDEYNFPGTFYINPGVINQSEFMSLANVEDLLARGHQIGSHTNLHIDLTSFEEGYVEADLNKATRFINEVGVKNIDFASPYGKIDDGILPAVMRQSLTHRGTEEDINTKQNYDVENLKGLFIRKETTDDEIKEYIQRTIDSNGWLILIYHRVEPTDLFFDVDRATFERHMKIVAESGVQVQTVRDAVNTIR